MTSMTAYLILLRGINVGGRNPVPMTRLRGLLERLGYVDVSTYIASGNVVLRSDKAPDEVKAEIEAALPSTFDLHSERVDVLVLTTAQLRSVVGDKPDGFGEDPDTYLSDAIFLIGIGAAEAMQVFDPRPDVDTVWPGDGVIYSQRLVAERTRSRLGKIVGTTAYKSMTIRNWKTTTTLLDLLERAEAGAS
jgi:uncharacterized protein (DUF1697 family)